jgi:hypothetical protein
LRHAPDNHKWMQSECDYIWLLRHERETTYNNSNPTTKRRRRRRSEIFNITHSTNKGRAEREREREKRRKAKPHVRVIKGDGGANREVLCLPSKVSHRKDTILRCTWRLGSCFFLY